MINYIIWPKVLKGGEANMWKKVMSLTENLKTQIHPDIVDGIINSKTNEKTKRIFKRV